MRDAQQAAPPEIIRNGARRALQNVLDNVNTTRGEMQGPPEAEGVPAGAFKFTVEPHGEPVETTDPHFVQKLLSEATAVKEGDGFTELGPRQQARVTDTIDSLTNQLDQYHGELASRPHFTPIDVPAALDATDNYGTAGDIMKNSVRDVYNRMAQTAAPGRLSELLQMPRSQSAEELQQLFDANSDKFSPEEWQTATDTYRKGFALNALHDAIQKGFNVSPEYAADTGATRTFTGSNKIANQLDDVLSSRGDDLREMLGNDGIRSIRRMNELLKGPETSGPLQQLLRSTAAVMRRHYGGVGGFIGSAAAPFLGVDHLTGTVSGAATGYALQKVINYAASNPAIADRMAYAVEHGVSPRVAAPLLATMMIRATAKEKPRNATTGR
jgi:hypothetical protein